MQTRSICFDDLQRAMTAQMNYLGQLLSQKGISMSSDLQEIVRPYPCSLEEQIQKHGICLECNTEVKNILKDG
jgi:hypothetical protein